MSDAPDIDLRGVPGDIRFECPSCHWGVTLKPAGAALWTSGGTITPMCKECDVPLTRSVIGHAEPVVEGAHREKTTLALGEIDARDPDSRGTDRQK